MAVDRLGGGCCLGCVGCLDPDGMGAGSMSKPDSPCRDCCRRAPGCHDATACPAWGQYQQDLAAWHELYRAATVSQAEMDNYDKGRRRAARNSSHRRDR